MSSDPRGIKYDGRFEVAEKQGPTIPIVSNETNSLLYEQRFWQRGAFFRRLPLSSSGPNGSYLVEESPTTEKGGDILEWTRLYAVLPPVRREYETTVHTYQFVQNASRELIEIPLTVQSTITYTYFHTTGTPVPALLKSFRFTKVGSEILVLGTPVLAGASTILHEDETFRRWKGNIYEKRSCKVPGFSVRVF